MGEMPDGFVDLVFTSPPYWGLRDYGVDGQIGFEDHPQKYIDKIVEVSRAVRRILKKSGSYYLVLGDTYCGTGAKRKIDGSNWLQPKQLLLLPSRIAVALQGDGWVLRNDCIWYKPNHMPSSVKDRRTTSFEHVFHFVKSRRYYYDLDSIRVPSHTTRWGGEPEI